LIVLAVSSSAFLSSVARTEKQNIAQFSPNIAQNVASDNKKNLNLKM
jgi:hypothetical protein